VKLGAEVIVSTYNEPMITPEWAGAVFREAKKAGLTTGFVSNGNATQRALEYLRPWLDVMKIDLKGFDDRHYRKLGGRLEPILRTIRQAHESGLWVEIVTLLVPGFNDSVEELGALTSFVAGVSPDIPWHVTAFHRDYNMLDGRDTTVADLLRAAEIGRRAGIRHVYAGNIPGRVADFENTRCPGCGAMLIERSGYRIGKYTIDPAGRCPKCLRPVPGRWAEAFRGQKSHRPFLAM
jgi:pyruvate formate lyase activating enzyme